MRPLLALLALIVVVSAADGDKVAATPKVSVASHHVAGLPVPPAAYGKMGPNGEYLGASQGNTKSGPSTLLSSVPIPRPAGQYEPRPTIHAAWEAQTGPGGAAVVAQCQIEAKGQAVTVANFVAITNVQCTDDTVTLSTDTSESAAAIGKAWQLASAGSDDQFHMVIPRHYQCNGVDEVAMRTATAVKIDAAAKQLVVTAAKASRADVVDSFDMTLTQYGAPPPAASIPTPAYGKKKAVQEPQHAKRGVFGWNKDGATSWDLGVNVNPGRQTLARDIPLLTTSAVTVKCASCSVYGEAQLQVHMTGSALVLKTYNVALAGEIGGTIDLAVQASGGLSGPLFDADLFTLPLSPVSIPGVLSLGPELRLRAAASYSVAGSAAVTAGMDWAYPFAWSAESQKGLFATPTTSVSSKGLQVNAHMPKLTANVDASVTAHLIPSVNLAFAVWKIPAFDLGMQLDNQIGVNADFQGQATVGGGGSVDASGHFDLKAFHQHDLALSLHSVGFNKEWSLWGSGQLPIVNLSADVAVPTKH
ncbi:hypothetical protein BC828DRAFT_390119 [Blastocladiella britannica]|nr:hypothetical protein BC828DRAFT_390119 [Blastocladiella britannica]